MGVTKLLLGLGNYSVHCLMTAVEAQKQAEHEVSLKLDSQSLSSRFSDRPCLKKLDGLVLEDSHPQLPTST